MYLVLYRYQYLIIGTVQSSTTFYYTEICTVHKDLKMFILFFTCQKKEPEPTQKIDFGSSSSFKSAPAPRKNLSSDRLRLRNTVQK